MKHQEIFDAVLQHMRRQRQPSLNATGNCMYRGGSKGQLRCAVGCLIADDNYDPEFEHQSPHDAGVAEALIHSGVSIAESADNRQFLSRLQKCHDRAWDSTPHTTYDDLENPDDDLRREYMRHFESNMAALAEGYELSYSEVA